jgi:phosphopantetheinyl transferase (holo-ACP synthase)
MSWRDIEIIEDGCGRLVVHLSGETARVAARQGIRRVHLAWAAPRALALAWAIAERATRGDADSSQEAIDGG